MGADLAALSAADRPADNVLLAGTVMKRAELMELKQTLGLALPQLKTLMEAFRRHVTVLGGAIVEEEEFYMVVREVFEGFKPHVAAKLFSLFDSDHSKSIDYRELCCGCARLMHLSSDEDKIKLLFEIYDSDGSGAIAVQELINIAHDKGLRILESANFIKNMMVVLDRNGDGVISLVEFLEAAERMPVPIHLRCQVQSLIRVRPFTHLCACVLAQQILFTAFHELLPHPRPELSLHLQHMQKTSGFDFDRLAQLSNYVRKKGINGEIDEGTFRSVLHKFFGFDDYVLVPGLFKTFDADSSGLIDFDELLIGLSRAIHSSPEERARFYFDTYSNEKGMLDAGHIHRLLDQSHSVVNNQMNADSTRSMLKAHGLGGLDHEGRPTICLAEFLELVAEDPNVLHAFGQVL